MGARGITISEQCHVVNLMPARDADAGALNTPVFSMKGYEHASIIIQGGVTGAGVLVTVFECDDFVPTNETAIPFSYYPETTAGQDTLGARTNMLASGFTTSVNDNIMYVLEIDPDRLTAGRNKIRLKFSDPGSITFMSAIAILSGGGVKAASPTALA